MRIHPSPQEIIDSCPKYNLGRMVIKISPVIPTAQDIIDLPDYWRDVDIVQWYNYRLKLLRKGILK